MRDELTGMELVLIPANCFMMGSNSDDKNHQDDEGPVHKVCLDAFWIGKYQVTQNQWTKIMESNPSKFKKGNTYPVEMVSWNDIQVFIAKINEISGRRYRLPTEAEWEYACRAGDSKKYDLDNSAWYAKNSDGSTHPVGEKEANAFGLHDMLGNVWEWCADRYGENYYASSTEKNPLGPLAGNSRVLRGGSWIAELFFEIGVNRVTGVCSLVSASFSPFRQANAETGIPMRKKETARRVDSYCLVRGGQ